MTEFNEDMYQEGSSTFIPVEIQIPAQTERSRISFSFLTEKTSSMFLRKSGGSLVDAPRTECLLFVTVTVSRCETVVLRTRIPACGNKSCLPWVQPDDPTPPAGGGDGPVVILPKGYEPGWFGKVEGAGHDDTTPFFTFHIL